MSDYKEKPVEELNGYELFQFRIKESGNKVLYINPNVEIFVKGRKINIDEKFRTLFLNPALESLDYKLSKKWIDEDRLENMKQKYLENGTKYIARGKFVK